MVTAYLLVMADSGMEKEVIEDLQELDEVEEAELIYGEWDIITKLNLPDVSMLGDFILKNIRGIGGVKKTSTLIVV
jgi:DNA-binding Lrp family transcriptional regulator